MTRIIGGSARGRPLKTPTGGGTRPTSDRVREALFSMLISEFGSLTGLHVLDLYAGSGAVGLEALSRGAERVVLVERDRSALQSIRANVAALGLGAEVVGGAVSEFLARGEDAFDVVYVDPPYSLGNQALEQVLTGLVDRLNAQALVIVERSSRDPRPAAPTGLRHAGERRYGETMLLLFEKQ